MDEWCSEEEKSRLAMSISEGVGASSREHFRSGMVVGGGSVTGGGTGPWTIPSQGFAGVPLLSQEYPFYRMGTPSITGAQVVHYCVLNYIATLISINHGAHQSQIYKFYDIK